MKTKGAKILMAIGAIALLTLNACEEAEAVGCDFVAESNTFSQRAQAFSNNPTSAGCSTTKQAALALLKKVRSCDGDQDGLVDQGVKAWEDIDCSDF